MVASFITFFSSSLYILFPIQAWNCLVFTDQYAKLGQYEVKALQIIENAIVDSHSPLLRSNNSYLDLLVSVIALLMMIMLMEMELSIFFFFLLEEIDP